MKRAADTARRVAQLVADGLTEKAALDVVLRRVSTETFGPMPSGPWAEISGVQLTEGDVDRTLDGLHAHDDPDLRAELNGA